MNSIPSQFQENARNHIGCGGEGGAPYPVIDLKNDNTTINMQTGNVEVEFGPETSAKVMACSDNPILFKVFISLDDVQEGAYTTMHVLCLPVNFNGTGTFHYGFTIDVTGGKMKAAATSLSADGIPAGLSINDIAL